MSDKELRLQVVFAALDKLTAPMKKIISESTVLGRAIKATDSRLQELHVQQKKVSQFQELKSGLKTTALELRNARQQAKGIGSQMESLRAQTSPAADAIKKLGVEQRKADAVVKKLSETYRANLERNREMRSSLLQSGISTEKLRSAQTWLKDSIALTNVELGSQQKRLAALSAQQHAYQQRVTNAKQHADKARAVAGNLAGAGISATVAGGAIGAPLVKGLQEAKHYQLETGRVTALGLGPQVSADAEKFARNMKTFGTSHTENLELVRDSMSVFGDLPHAQMVAPTLAKMKFGNKAFYGAESGEENERKFMDMLKVIEMRGGTASAEKFHGQANMVQKVITATGGRVGPGEWLNMIKTGGIAAKGMDDKSFYYQMEPLVQEMGGHRVGTGTMSAYNNLYQGRTSKRAAMNLEKLGLIGDHSKVKFDKAGQTAQLDPGALLGSDLFKKSQFAWMEQVLLPQLAKKGITDQGRILDTIGSIFSNRTASDLHANMYLQRNQIHKNEKLNAGAYDIDQINTLGQQQASGKESDVTAKLADLKLTMGEKILPLYADAIVTVTNALKGLNAFMEKNPATAKVMIVAFTALAGILVVLGPLMLGLATLIGPYAMLHVLFAKMGIAGGVLTPILRGLGSAFLAVGTALKTVGVFFLTNPIGWTILAIVAALALLAGAAYLIYQNWEPIKGFFGGIWTDIKQAFNGGILGITALMLNWSPLGLFYQAFAGVLRWFGVDMPAKFTDFGANIMRGLVDGITGALGWVKTTITGAGEKVIGWFKEKLGIHSPSRVFAELGHFTMQGLAVGLQRSEDAPIGQVSGLAKRLTQLGAGIAISTAAMPALAFDTRPPIAPRAASGGMVVQGDTIQITIQAAPGMDEHTIARAVAQALDQRDRQKAARIRSSLSDTHA